MHPTQQLLEYISIFIGKPLSDGSIQLARINILEQLVAYRKRTITDWCIANKLCEFCQEKYEIKESHECEE